MTGSPKEKERCYSKEPNGAAKPLLLNKSAVASYTCRSPTDLITDLNTFGLIFETLCMRDIRVYAEALNGNVYHYRDKDGLECDAVVHLRDGRYGLIEVKLGGDKLIAEGAPNLNRLAQKIDTTKMKQPAFMMVLTATGDYAYRREDGVLVVPIGSMKD